ncbi:MAG TPA: CDP-alcohol phosphatidyltransferase family protein [Hyphomicrobiaceae bacterium]|nr:CDP-alcohol phosphatidyltransferase family protein [Hyphomicrobiaceae bacterium]
MPPRPLLFSAGLQLALLGSALFAAAMALQWKAAFGWCGFGAALTCFGAVATLVLLGLGHHTPHRSFGVANAVTLIRAAVDALMVGVVAEMLLGGSLIINATLSWVLVATAAAALLLDGVDGWAARRTGMASEFGARFDMETDALFLLMLSMLVHATGKVGIWVLASGSMRYGFVLAGWRWPSLAGQLVPRRRRKAIYAVQVSALIAALAPAASAQAANAMCLAGLGLLSCSFAADCIWLARRASHRR